MPEMYNLFGETNHQEGQKKSIKLHSLFAPLHDGDKATERTSAWARKWKMPNTHVFISESASYQNAIDKLINKKKLNHTFAFVGHGSEIEIFTNIKIGKLTKNESSKGSLLDCNDINVHSCMVSIVAWACYSAKEFGVEVAKCSKCKFFGFSQPVNIIVGNPKCEALWSGLIEKLFLRIITKNGIEHSDKNWFKSEIDKLIVDINIGKNSAGKYLDTVNKKFLIEIKNCVEVYC
jgi:hypothetical protein